MKVAVLFSGGKDSNYALFEALKYFDVACLLTMKSLKEDSYMFQVPMIEHTKLQAECMNIKHELFITSGTKEEELVDLDSAIKCIKEKYGIDGIVSGAIKSVYQASRIEKICKKHDLWCFNPLWQINEKEFLIKIINEGFKVLIVGIGAYPLDKKLVGKLIDHKMVDDLCELNAKYGISIAGEGGEFETFVIDSPVFKRQIIVCDNFIIEDSKNCARMIVNKIKTCSK